MIKRYANYGFHELFLILVGTKFGSREAISNIILF